MDENKQKILLVEDEPDARELYADVLLNAGFDIDTAIDGQDAEDKMAVKKYDLILLDIITPRKDGIQTLDEIKKNPNLFGSPKVVMLSNIAGDIAIEKAMELGADGYMLKSDIEPSDLLDMVRKYFE